MKGVWVVHVIVGILILSGLGSIPKAEAALFIISDQASCQSFGGVWNVPTSTCSVTNILINALDTVQINSDVTLLLVQQSGINLGTIEVLGTLMLADSAGAFNDGGLDNDGTINVASTGSIVDEGFTNGAIDNTNGTINFDCGATIALTIIFGNPPVELCGIETAVASNTSGENPGTGIDTGDTVVITFSSPTNAFSINSGNIDTVLSLSGAHTWGSSITAVWSTTTNTDDTLTITLDSTSSPTVAVGDTITIQSSTIVVSGNSNPTGGTI